MKFQIVKKVLVNVGWAMNFFPDYSKEKAETNWVQGRILPSVM